jgi:hypothetical protein
VAEKRTWSVLSPAGHVIKFIGLARLQGLQSRTRALHHGNILTAYRDIEPPQRKQSTWEIALCITPRRPGRADHAHS